MRRRRPVAYFAVVFTVAYALLAIPWPGWQAAYSSAYRRAANALFDPFGVHVLNEAGETVKLGRVAFRPAAKPDRSSDTDIWTRLRRSRDVGAALHSPRLTGYVPTVEFIALALATPAAWRRRMVGLAAGLVIMHGFIYARLWIALMFYFSTPDAPWQMYEFSDTAFTVLELLNGTINVAPVTSFVAPAIVWLILLFRPGDWGGTFEALLAGDASEDETAAAATSPEE